MSTSTSISGNETNAKQAVAALLDLLSAALEEEYAALSTRDVVRLERAVARKTELIGALETASGKYCRDGKDLLTQWPDLQPLAARCAAANQVNGGAIKLNQGMVTRLLDIMHGAGREAPVYSANGRMRRGDGSRLVGSA